MLSAFLQNYSQYWKFKYIGDVIVTINLTPISHQQRTFDVDIKSFFSSELFQSTHEYKKRFVSILFVRISTKECDLMWECYVLVIAIKNFV